VGEKLYKISSYLNKEELRQFMVWVRARGVGQSGFIREQLSFDVRPRGAPKGKRKKAPRKLARLAKTTKPKVATKQNRNQSSATESRDTQLSLLD
jgi:hypothetical protein